MSWYFNGILLQDTSTNYSPQGARVSITCDSASDLPTVATVQSARGITPIIGSTADCVDDSSVYVLDSSGVWHQVQQSPYSDVYTKSEVDTLLNDYVPTSDVTNSISQGSTDVITAGGCYNAVYYISNNGFIPASSDLSSADYQSPGRWYYTAGNAPTFLNRPNHANFIASVDGGNPVPGMLEFIQVYKSGNVTRGIQRIYISGARFFMRGYQNNSGTITWNAWHLYEGTNIGSLP